MTFLTPWPAITAAALALPALIFLYLLKLRRLPARIPSTLLWRKSVEDLQVNAPLQRLRLTLLFLLQLLILLLLLVAMGQPVIEGAETSAARIILLIDRSASMNARGSSGGDTTRLDQAKDAARDIINRLGESNSPSEAMIIAFARTPQVIASFDGDRRALRDAIAGIDAVDEPADLAAALQLADAYAGSDETSGAAPAVVILSDGSVGAPDDARGRRGFTVRAAEVQYIRIGEDDPTPLGNIGIVALNARRRFDDPSRIDLFVQVANTSAIEVETVITLRIDAAVAAVRSITIPPSTADALGLAAESFDLELDGSAVITAMISGDDGLAVDDIASVVMPEIQPPRILLVAPDAAPDPFVLGLLQSALPAALHLRASFQPEDDPSPDDTAYDLIVFDRTAPAQLPAHPTLFFGAIPPGIESIAPETEAATRILSWNRAHRLMQHVELEEIIFDGFGAFRASADVQDEVIELALGRQGPVIGASESQDALHVFVGFELLRSNWPADVSLLIFLQNVIDNAMGPAAGGESLAFATGDVVRVPVATGAERLVMTGPANAMLDAGDREVITLPVLRWAGVYQVEGAEPPMSRIAVNLVNEMESDIRVRDEIEINAEDVSSLSAEEAGSRPLWPWALATALILLVLEWMVYVRKSRI